MAGIAIRNGTGNRDWIVIGLDGTTSRTARTAATLFAAHDLIPCCTSLHGAAVDCLLDEREAL